MKMAAHDIQVGLCPDPKCKCVHIDLIDGNGKIFAFAAVPVGRIEAFVGSLQGCAYMIATGEKPK